MRVPKKAVDAADAEYWRPVPKNEYTTRGRIARVLAAALPHLLVRTPAEEHLTVPVRSRKGLGQDPQYDDRSGQRKMKRRTIDNAQVRIDALRWAAADLAQHADNADGAVCRYTSDPMGHATSYDDAAFVRALRRIIGLLDRTANRLEHRHAWRKP